MRHSLLLSWLYCLSSRSILVNAVVEREPSGKIAARTVKQGWSLQAATCPGGSISCGRGSCCPSGLYCIAAANDEVPACCSTNSACRGAVEGAPVCADSSWSLWKGFQGNGFCCQVGLVGIYDNHNPVAGTCVSSAAAVGATSAVLMSTGSGSAPTPVSPSDNSIPASPTPSPPTSSSSSSSSSTEASSPPPSSSPSTEASSPSSPPSSPSSPASAASSTPPSSNPSPPGATGKPVFFHYLIGTLTDAHCQQDIQNAQALGADGFALNIDTVTASYATTSVSQLFKWANTYGFKLFFSFDMTGFNNPNQFTSFLLSYVTDPAHYTYKGLPFVSTFNGGSSQYTFGQDSVNDGWKVMLQQAMATAGHPIYFIPAFQDAPNGGTDFFTTYSTVDGAMNWNSWPMNTQGDIIVPTTDDQAYLSGAHAVGKTFMMGVSPLQFKHIDGNQNYYRRGEQNLEYRFGQVLSMQPDFVEIQTWNDAGEGHYMGNIWPEPVAGSDIGAYSATYDHTGYWQILPAFIKAFKAGATDTSGMVPTNGKPAQGTFWHHTLLVGGDCSSDPLGKPVGVNTAEDKVTVVVLVAAGTTNLRVDISSGATHLGGVALVPGYNQYSVSGLTAGTVKTTVTDSSGATVLSGSGPIDVSSTASLCNYNFQVVGLQ